LIGINQPFEESAGEDVRGIIDHWANDTLIIHTYLASYEQPKDTFIVKTEYASYDGIIIERIVEQPIVGGGIGGEFDFDSIKIANNQIRFYGAKSKFGNQQPPPNEVVFPCGEVTIYSDSGQVTKIEIEKQHKSMNFSRIDESGEKLYNQPEVSINTYEFIPKKKINPIALGEIGIFKNFKIASPR
jgi:hypothetical protein